MLPRLVRGSGGPEKQANDQAEDQLRGRAASLGCEVVWNLERHDWRGYAITGEFQAAEKRPGMNGAQLRAMLVDFESWGAECHPESLKKRRKPLNRVLRAIDDGVGDA